MLLSFESFVAALLNSEAAVDLHRQDHPTTCNSDTSATSATPAAVTSSAIEAQSPPWRPRTMQEWLT